MHTQTDARAHGNQSYNTHEQVHTQRHITLTYLTVQTCQIKMLFYANDVVVAIAAVAGGAAAAAVVVVAACTT